MDDQQPAEKGAAAVAAPCVGGNAAGYLCSNVDLLAHMPLSTFGASSANDIWGWTDPFNGRVYALIGLDNGTGFIDISDPENPVYVGKLPTYSSSSSWRDIKVYGNHAFVVGEAVGHGMQVIDLNRLRNVASPPVSFSEDAHYDGINDAQNIMSNEQSSVAYIVGAGSGMQSGCNRGLHIVDINAPTASAFAGCFAPDGYMHDAQFVIYNGPDLEHIGQEICINANEDTITIVDVSDKANPVQLLRTGYSGCTGTSNCYTHQAWLSEDQSVLLTNDELDELNGGFPYTRTYIWDISDLDALSSPLSHDSTEPAIDISTRLAICSREKGTISTSTLQLHWLIQRIE